MKIQSFNIGYGPKLLSWTDKKSVEYNLRLLPLGGFVAFPSNVPTDDDGNEIMGVEDDDVDEDPDLMQNRPPLQRAAVISAGVFANLLLTFGLQTIVAASYGIPHPVYNPGVIVTTTPDPNAPAARAGVRLNDVIMSVNHEVFLTRHGDEQGSTTVDDFVALVKRSEGVPLALDVVRDGSPLSAPLVVTPSKNAASGRVSIGIGVAQSVKEAKLEVARDPVQAVQMGLAETRRTISLTWKAFTKSLSSGFSGSEIGGPLSIIKTGAAVAENNPVGLASFAATLSVNLAILNALPFPALDGGQLAFVMVELATGRPLRRDVRETATVLAFVFLVALGATAFVGDIERLTDPVILAPRAPSGDAPMIKEKRRISPTRNGGTDGLFPPSSTQKTHYMK